MNRPEIHINQACINKSTNEMFVTWSTNNINDIVSIIVSAKNTVTGVDICANVSWSETEVSFKINDEPADYYVTITVFNNCRQNFSSAPYPASSTESSMETFLYTSTEALLSTSAAKPTSSSRSVSHFQTQQCSQNDRGKCTVHLNEKCLETAHQQSNENKTQFRVRIY